MTHKSFQLVVAELGFIPEFHFEYATLKLVEISKLGTHGRDPDQGHSALFFLVSTGMYFPSLATFTA